MLKTDFQGRTTFYDSYIYIAFEGKLAKEEPRRIGIMSIYLWILNS